MYTHCSVDDHSITAEDAVRECVIDHLHGSELLITTKKDGSHHRPGL